MWWTPPDHVRVMDVTALKKERLIGSITGTFDSSYSDEFDLSAQEHSDLVLYEVEVGEMEADLRSIFGFRTRGDVHFEVPAEAIWSLPAGAALTTAYELYYYTEHGEWGIPMSKGERKAQVHRVVLQQVQKLKAKKIEPTQESFEIAWLWLKAVSKLAATRMQQA